MTIPLAQLLGVVLLAASWWSWRGRSRRARWWVGSYYGRELVLAILPGIGVLIVGATALTLVKESAPSWFDIAVLLTATPMLFALLVEFAGICTLLPRWWAPAWYRALPASEREAVDDAFSAVLTVFGGRDGVDSARAGAAVFGDAAPRGGYRGAWVYDPDTEERSHGLSGKGAVEGRVMLYREGVVFAASRAEDSLRDNEVVLSIAIDDIVDVRVVPPRAGADGRPRAGVRYRSIFPRIVLCTSNGDYVFDVPWWRAKKVADQVRELAAE